MTNESFAPRLLDAHVEDGAKQRMAIAQKLALGTGRSAAWDEIARGMAEKAHLLEEDQGAPPPIALVNLYLDKQNFVGVYVDPRHPAFGQVPDNMPDGYGGCPMVIKRGKSLVLDDICAMPRFASNPAVDQFGVRSYAGAPLIHDGIPFGTVCVIDQEPKPDWDGRFVDLVKSEAAGVLDRIHRGAHVLG